MAKRVLLCLVLALCLLGLGGCVFGSVDEMYALPKSSEAYVNLQAKINQEKGDGEFIAPLSGENRQTIQLVDVDGDDIQEAVVFFRDPEGDAPLRIVVFKQDDQGEYQVYTRIQGVGSEIESIEYVDLGGAGACDILVSWQVGTALRTLVGYTITDGQPTEIMRATYSRALTADLDGDGQEEVILAQAEEGGATRIEYYDSRDGALILSATAPLSEGTSDISTWTAGLLEEDVPALFVTSFFGRDVLVTDIFVLDERLGLQNLALDQVTRRSDVVFHYYAGVEPEDIDGEGLIEVPVAVPVPSYGESSVDQFWWMEWMHYTPDGTRELVMTTYHSGDGWYLEIPDAWIQGEEIAMCRQESSTIGVRSVTFARTPPGAEEEAEPEPYLEICCLMGSDRGRQAKQNERFTLYGDTTTIYTAEFLDSGWDCGLDEQSLTSCFHASTGAWNTSE